MLDSQELSRQSESTAGAVRGVVVGVALLAAVALATLNDGGFDARSQSVFVVLAGIALLTAGMLDGDAVAGIARSRLSLVLLALAVVSVASAAWTVDGRGAALRSGLVIGGYGAVFVTSATLARRTGPWPFAIALLALALVEGILGLHALAAHALPDAERIDGAWRPGGTFQYPPALAILEVGALPVSCVLLAHRSALACACGAAAITLAGAVLGLSESRLGLALAVALLAALIVRRPAALAGRAVPLAAVALFATGALGARAALGADAAPAGWSGLAAIAGLAAGCAIVWPLTRRTVARRDALWLALALCCATPALVTFAAAGHGGSHAAAEGSNGSRRPATDGSDFSRHESDFLHGRGREWRAALETWFDRPLLGSGAGSYRVASLSHQDGAPVGFAHDLPLEFGAELGVLGLLLGLALYLSSAVVVSRAIHSSSLWLLAPMAVAFLASNLLDWTWHLAGLGAIWAASVGALRGADDL
jgi:O-Antigen ligase